MTHAYLGPPSNRADRKRQPGRGVRSQAIWRVPFRRARQAIDSGIGRIETSGRVIDATLRFRASPPRERVRQLLQLANWLDQAVARLERAFHGMEETVERAPEYAADFTLPFLGAAMRCIETIGRLDKLAVRAAEASAQLVQVSPRRPRFVIIVTRRSTFAFATVADAARKVSRGRAPPLSQPALSIHCS